MPLSAPEDRSPPRWPVKVDVRYGTAGEMNVGEGLDINHKGIGFRGDQAYPVGTKIALEFRFSDAGTHWIRAQAVVRRSEGREIGAEFLGLTEEEEKQITQLIRKELAVRREEAW